MPVCSPDPDDYLADDDDEPWDEWELETCLDCDALLAPCMHCDEMAHMYVSIDEGYVCIDCVFNCALDTVASKIHHGRKIDAKRMAWFWVKLMIDVRDGELVFL